MVTRWQAQLQQRLRGECLCHESLAPLTSWRVGGPAEMLVAPVDDQDVVELWQVIDAYQLPWCVLGGGSNVLIADRGIAGVVIKLNHFDQIEVLNNQRLRVGAGCSLGQLVRFCNAHGYAGFESLAGIPGSVGGAVAVNAGALGQQIGDRVECAQLYTRRGLQQWSGQQFDFCYRCSAVGRQHLLTRIELSYVQGDAAQLKLKASSAIEHRRNAHAVGGPNAGSVFKNPPGLQAWKLIDQCGLRGACEGQAQISHHHTNFIVNLGGAHAEEIHRLIRFVQQTVIEQTGIRLETEVRMLGDFGEE